MKKQAQASVSQPDTIDVREYGFRIEQISGPRLDKQQFPGVSQARNIGGEHVGIVGRIFALIPGYPVVIQTETRTTVSAAQDDVGRWLDRLYRPDLVARPEGIDIIDYLPKGAVDELYQAVKDQLPPTQCQEG